MKQLQFKGTQGEWKFEKKLGYDCDVIHKGGEICWLGLSNVSDEEQEANAKLIAVAPELLKALIKSVNSMKLADEAEFRDEIKQATEAINKALII
tara:strand:+ start:40 stop:324 length:285 start_codon:yes stop_codon:yes gene_type:complete